MFHDPETWVAISFIIFVGLLVYLKVPARIAGALDTRSASIAKELEETRRLRIEAETVLAEYKRRTSNLNEEAEGIIAQAEREAAAYMKETRTSFDEMLKRRMAMAEHKIRQEEDKARKDIRAQAAELAIEAAEHLIEQKVSGRIAEDMITSSIDRVKKRLH